MKLCQKYWVKNFRFFVKSIFCGESGFSWNTQYLIIKYLHIHEFFLIFGLLGYVHINDSFLEVIIGDLGGPIVTIGIVWAMLRHCWVNVTKKIWFCRITSGIQTGMCGFSVCLSNRVITRGRTIGSIIRVLRFLRFLKNTKTLTFYVIKFGFLRFYNI